MIYPVQDKCEQDVRKDCCFVLSRHRTIKKPGLTLTSRRRLVSRCVTGNWIISSLLSMTLSLSYFQSSRFALSTLDPFMRSFYAAKNPSGSHEEHVAVTLVILLAFSAGLVVILVAYYSICKALSAVSHVGRNRISPGQTSPHLQSDSSDLTLSIARSYRPQYTIRPQQGDPRLSGPPSGQGTGGGVRTHDKRVPEDLRADLPYNCATDTLYIRVFINYDRYRKANKITMRKR
ncbi:hypothetical protein PoB_003630000 [Plakobranchus ocellatus]|uniref:Uncharacterized protein n=1 Tax=Plakobranchus ocellatus TaxID=259542 RepID=A0AAV4ASD0_9GAST|nr:hypothetical protein PoB_003630000 [Plakobranchus ocellatus]